MANETKWSIDTAHSNISFKIKHLMISNVMGHFQTFDANIYTTNSDFTTSVIDVWIDVASISTGNAQRDEHLKSADFFDVKHYKQITFRASTIEKIELNVHNEFWGDLTIKGITKRVKLLIEFGGIAQDTSGNEKVGFTVIGRINRSDWGLTWSAAIEIGGLVVSEVVLMTCDIELMRVNQENLKMVLELPDVAQN